MNDRPPGSVEARKPYWPVAAGLLGIIVVLVVGGFLLNSRSRGNTGAAGGPIVSAAVSPAASAGSAAILANSTAPPPASSAGSSTPASANASAVPSSSSNSPLEQEVTAAYEHFWDVYSNAVLQLDSSQLSQVATGEALQQLQAEVDALRKRNRAVRVVVTHHYMVFNVTTTQATVYDEVNNQSFTVDPVTKQPPQGSSQSDIEKDTYFFQKADDVWKVARSTRQQDSSQ